MDIQKAIENALKVISEKQPEVRQVYKLQRRLARMGKLQLLRSDFAAGDFQLVGRDALVPVRMYYPRLEKEKWRGRGVILFFHGGGWVTGNVDSYNRVCASLAEKTGCRVASVDYRLAPEHPFPAGFDDCYEVSRQFFRNSSFLFDIPPEKLVLAGDSAGGNLAAAVSLKARDTGDFDPRYQILLYPALNDDYTENSPYESVRTNGKDYVLTAERVQEYIEMYLGKGVQAQPYAAPLKAGDFTRQPQTLLITAELDPLRDEGEDYADRLAQAGNTVYKMRIHKALHGFISLPAGTGPAKKAFGAIRAFLKENGVAD